MPEKDLKALLSSMDPQLQEAEYVFCSIDEADYRALEVAPLCLFREEEGVSLVLEKSLAESASLKFTKSWKLITCKINSDLNAVGFLAAMAWTLAEAGIAVNAVSAYFHDHLFVPDERAEEALNLLRRLSGGDGRAD